MMTGWEVRIYKSECISVQNHVTHIGGEVWLVENVIVMYVKQPLVKGLWCICDDHDVFGLY